LKRYIEQLLGKLAETPRSGGDHALPGRVEPAEIADVLDMPVATVKSHLQRSWHVRRKLSFATEEGKS